MIMGNDDIKDGSVFYMSSLACKKCKDLAHGEPHHWGDRWLFGVPVIVNRFLTDDTWFLIDTPKLVELWEDQMDKAYGPLPWKK